MRAFYFFLSGFLLMLACSFYLDWSTEEEVLGVVAKKVENSSIGKDSSSKIETAVNLSNYLVQSITKTFGNEDLKTWKTKMISPSFQSFYYGTGACGTHTLFVARLLKRMGYTSKIVQQKQHGYYGAHITLAIECHGKLLLVDPLFNTVFKDSTGQISDINDVAKNWSYYKTKLPADYDTTLNYQNGWRYTNWDKYGAVSQFVYKASCAIIGKQKTDNFSLRYYCLGVSIFYAIAAFIGFLFFFYRGIKRRNSY